MAVFVGDLIDPGPQQRETPPTTHGFIATWRR